MNIPVLWQTTAFHSVARIDGDTHSREQEKALKPQRRAAVNYVPLRNIGNVKETRDFHKLAEAIQNTMFLTQGNALLMLQRMLLANVQMVQKESFDAEKKLNPDSPLFCPLDWEKHSAIFRYHGIEVVLSMYGGEPYLSRRLPPKELPAYVRSDDLMRNSEMTTIVDDVHKALTTEAQLELIDQENLRHQEDWSHLSNKVFGAEGEDRK